jgi:hypothetical protein
MFHNCGGCTMKRVAVALLIAAVAGTSAWAQKTKAGDKAWLFTLSGLSNLGVGGYNGGLGLLYYLNDDLGLTVGLGFSTSSTTTKAPAGSGGADETESSLGLTLSPGVRFNIASSGPVVGYAGVGVLVGISSETTENPRLRQRRQRGEIEHKHRRRRHRWCGVVRLEQRELGRQLLPGVHDELREDQDHFRRHHN